VDIQLSVRSLTPRERYVEPLAGLGYRWTLDPWDVEHEFFSRDVDGERAFNTHVCLVGSEWERRHLLFRDHLRAHPEEAVAYADLKRRLSAAHPRDGLTYNEAKSDFIVVATERASSERSGAGQGPASED
jgi:GrpB-like predicted nucleotidyltransferase (UPF0157 family)